MTLKINTKKKDNDERNVKRYQTEEEMRLDWIKKTSKKELLLCTAHAAAVNRICWNTGEFTTAALNSGEHRVEKKQNVCVCS
ncbi:hypothetical protein Y032_0330g2711 [Ancylostoma ceylanicum]|uniref:Uncharacterized protein n=1 Tax=Ancylostoma ceylanicum TaxID=53326 RepID=A0A016RZH3_9BILA|nr:hypothetical protein Y032_0330g2711 [Ancylostoma ceylanicum]